MRVLIVWWACLLMAPLLEVASIEPITLKRVAYLKFPICCTGNHNRACLLRPSVVVYLMSSTVPTALGHVSRWPDMHYSRLRADLTARLVHRIFQRRQRIRIIMDLLAHGV